MYFTTFIWEWKNYSKKLFVFYLINLFYEKFFYFLKRDKN